MSSINWSPPWESSPLTVRSKCFRTSRVNTRDLRDIPTGPGAVPIKVPPDIPRKYGRMTQDWPSGFWGPAAPDVMVYWVYPRARLVRSRQFSVYALGRVGNFLPISGSQVHLEFCK